MNNYFNGKYINEKMTNLRNDLRTGKTRVKYKLLGSKALKVAVQEYLWPVEQIFHERHINPQSMPRFEVLFDVQKDAYGNWPSQKATANAIQNFINRRKEIWSADPLAGVMEVVNSPSAN